MKRSNIHSVGGLSRSIQAKRLRIEQRRDAVHLASLGFNQRQSAELMRVSRGYVNRLLNTSEADDVLGLEQAELALNDAMHAGWQANRNVFELRMEGS